MSSPKDNQPVLAKIVLIRTFSRERSKPSSNRDEQLWNIIGCKRNCLRLPREVGHDMQGAAPAQCAQDRTGRVPLGHRRYRVSMEVTRGLPGVGGQSFS